MSGEKKDDDDGEPFAPRFRARCSRYACWCQPYIRLAAVGHEQSAQGRVLAYGRCEVKLDGGRVFLRTASYKTRETNRIIVNSLPHPPRMRTRAEQMSAVYPRNIAQPSASKANQKLS